MGVATTALYLICQIRVMKAASHAKVSAGTLNVSAANAGIGLGAIVGGLAIPVWGPSSVSYVAALIALIAATALFFIARLVSRQSGPESWARQAFCAEPGLMQGRASGALLFPGGPLLLKQVQHRRQHAIRYAFSTCQPLPPDLR